MGRPPLSRISLDTINESLICHRTWRRGCKASPSLTPKLSSKARESFSTISSSLRISAQESLRLAAMSARHFAGVCRRDWHDPRKGDRAAAAGSRPRTCGRWCGANRRNSGRTGFGDPERMRRAFIRAFGQPPQALRRNAKSAGYEEQNMKRKKRTKPRAAGKN